MGGFCVLAPAEWGSGEAYWASALDRHLGVRLIPRLLGNGVSECGHPVDERS